METGLFWDIAVGLPHRTGVAGKAALLPAGSAGGRADMVGAAVDLIAVYGKSRDRTGREAGAVPTAVAGAGLHWPGGQGEPRLEAKGGAVGMPKAEIGMDEDAQGRGVDPIGLERPTLERVIGWAVEWEEGCACTKLDGGRTHEPARPTIERIGLVAAATLEGPPQVGTGIAHQHERAGAVGQAILRQRMEPASAQQSVAGEPFGDRR